MAFLGDGLVIRYKPGAAAAVPGKTQTGDFNLSNILKLIPGEVVAVYLASKGAFDGVYWGQKWPFWLCWICLIVCFLLRYVATMKSPGGVNWPLILVTTAAFFIWAHAVSDTAGPVIAGFYGAAAGTLATVFGALAPKVVPAQP
jgi:hypothetical protein